MGRKDRMSKIKSLSLSLSLSLSVHKAKNDGVCVHVCMYVYVYVVQYVYLFPNHANGFVWRLSFLANSYFALHIVRFFTLSQILSVCRNLWPLSPLVYHVRGPSPLARLLFWSIFRQPGSSRPLPDHIFPPPSFPYGSTSPSHVLAQNAISFNDSHRSIRCGFRHYRAHA